MRGVRTSINPRRRLFAVLAAVLALLGFVHGRNAGAQAPAAVSCGPIEQQLREATRLANACETSRLEAERGRAMCNDELSSTSDRLHEAKARVDACSADKDALCKEASAFVRGLLRGNVTNVGTCIAAEEQRDLFALLKGWDNASGALARLGAFAAGESDALPPSPGGQTISERLAGRLVGTVPHEPLFYRRLLAEALTLIAPRAWQRIVAAGPGAVEAWFASRDALAPAIVDEAQREHSATAGAGGPSLSVALRLVQSFVFLARCAEDEPSHACARAHQLEQLLDATGPLLVRRRIEGIWATACTDIQPSTVLSWVQDFPSSQLSRTTANFTDVSLAAQAKLYNCYLGDSDGEPAFRVWLGPRMPSPKALDARTLPRVDAIRVGIADDSPTDKCGRAVRAMQSLSMPVECIAPETLDLAKIAKWAELASSVEPDTLPLESCKHYARLLWEGNPTTIAGSYAHPPALEEMVFIDPRLPETPIGRLRRACEERRGTGDAFVRSLRRLSQIAKGFGDSPQSNPWRIDPVSDVPIEGVRFDQASTRNAWLKHVFARETSCQALGLPDSRCQQCLSLPRDTFFDCDRRFALESLWADRGRLSMGALLSLLFAGFSLAWSLRLVRARRLFGAWAEGALERLRALHLEGAPDPWRLIVPSRHDVLGVKLPREAAWERWGEFACVVKVHDRSAIRESDVNHAVKIAARIDAKVVFLLHEDAASLDFSAVRAILDWAARGGARTVHVLPLAVSRLLWARSATDLLDLVEEASLRGNPFEVRGRITSSSQFWNRERLVSGLLAETRAGRWLVVTGLRRFGKSSLCLEVARRLMGPSAYVDLAGFHHEIGFLEDPSLAVDAVLRSVCARLADSAASLYPEAALPEAPKAEVDAAAVTAWLRKMSAACAPHSGGRPPPMLIVLDELEQVLTIGPDRLGHVLDVLSILLGRLRNAVGDAPHPEASSPVGILLSSALHPLLWAPLRTLGQQSIMGAFPSVCVPALPFEASSAMMRGLGARQGIRFTEEALDYIIAQSHGVPLLLRRIGTSVLELYDAEHARQGGLGAVQIGIEGAKEAVEREQGEGSPIRVWVESEIAERTGPAGAMLRRLASEERVLTTVLREIAERYVKEQFASSRITSHLPEEEVLRRAQEAASVFVRLLGETKLLVSHGDLTAPEAYELPEGAIRRVLREERSSAELLLRR